ncbi:protein outspread-like, partial [Musca vetustissima]|uniref:protein outspread-like n=1 Tax=Musca vetustissima TaxID=27455 RepID=UPI002AB6A677
MSSTMAAAAPTSTSSSSAPPTGGVTRTSDCRKFSPNIFNKSKCSHCFRQREEHSAAALECNRASRKVSKCGYLFVAPDWDFSNPLYRTKVSLLITNFLHLIQTVVKIRSVVAPVLMAMLPVIEKSGGSEAFGQKED